MRTAALEQNPVHLNPVDLLAGAARQLKRPAVIAGAAYLAYVIAELSDPGVATLPSPKTTSPVPATHMPTPEHQVSNEKAALDYTVSLVTIVPYTATETETSQQIAQKNGISTQELMHYNGERVMDHGNAQFPLKYRPDHVSVGDHLMIPKRTDGSLSSLRNRPSRYSVANETTFPELADKLGVTLDAVTSVNRVDFEDSLNGPWTIAAGSTVRIPLQIERKGISYVIDTSLENWEAKLIAMFQYTDDQPSNPKRIDLVGTDYQPTTVSGTPAIKTRAEYLADFQKRPEDGGSVLTISVTGHNTADIVGYATALQIATSNWSKGSYLPTKLK